MPGLQVGRLLVCLAVTTGLWQKRNILQAGAVASFLTAAEFAQQAQGAEEQSWAVGKGQIWQAGSS